MAAPIGRIRIVLIQESPLLRAGLRVLLEQQGLVIVGEATTCPQAVDLARQEQPDILLVALDRMLPSSLDQLPAVLTAAARARLLVVLSPHEQALQQQAVRLGATGIVWRDEPPATLFRAIEKVHAGEVWIDRMVMARVLAGMVQARGSTDPDPEIAKIATLTAREREVIALIGEGLKNKQIASRLSITETTTRHHLTSIFSKLGVTDRLALVIYAYRYGLAHPPERLPWLP